MMGFQAGGVAPQESSSSAFPSYFIASFAPYQQDPLRNHSSMIK